MQKIMSRIGIMLMLLMTLTQASYAADQQAVKSRHPSQHSKAEAKMPVDVNTADAKTLTTLKGIGAKKAQAIIKYREKNGNFKSVQELASVKGIGQKALVRIMKNNPNRIVINS
jgi:competence protein ComEA